MSEQTKITDLLNPLCLQQLYEGEESGILLILGKKQISDRYIRLRVRDARHQDNEVCDIKEVLDEVQKGDIRWFIKCVCINTPNCLLGSEAWARHACGENLRDEYGQEIM